MEQGAKLEGTEDPKLLLKEYEMLKNTQKTIHAAKNDEQKAQMLLRERDAFIAQRIKNTLKEEEVGILFIGLMHRVDEVLDSGISVSYLIYHLPFKRNFEMKKNYG
jgi:pheromone shutdown protein TraB